MKQMRDKIIQLIKEIEPDFVVFEGVQYQNNQLTYSQLSQLQGIIMGYFFDINMGFTIVKPSEWKSYCGIKGRKREEQKKNTQEFVKKKYDIEVNEDTADAIGIGVWTVNKVKSKE